ncbi:MAG: hypothetical protein DWH91_04850 [Planctomycetota bacterium]|nr:MAG: hypothetical protein DWH91_04850 [Planctomycetota bacterium]
MILPQTAPTRLRNCLRLTPMMGLLGVLACVLASEVAAQQPAPMMLRSEGNGASGSATGFPESHIFGDAAPEDLGVGGMGMLGRLGHVAGDTVGRSQSITYLDLAPYMFVEDTYFFSQGSLFITNQGKMGGTAGVGVRQYFADRDFVLGVAGFYDHDESRDVRFQQAGISVELFSQWMDIRANWSKPFGELVQELGTSITPNSARFSGNNITFATQTRVSAAAEGLDLLFTVPVPGEVAQSVNMEASAGVYNYQAVGQNLDQALGWRLRLDADFADRLIHGFTEITKDQVFDTDLIVGVDVNYWGHLEDRPRFGSSQINRIAQWVRRNRTVVTIDSIRNNGDQVAINPNTGDPYFLYHVRNVPDPAPLPNFPAPTGTGAIETPFQFIEEAQNALPDSDLIFVHADSVYDARPTLDLNDGELVLGEGSGLNQTVPVVFGNQTADLTLPRATNGTNRPLFSNSVGPAVNLGNNNLFAGFDIQSPTGTAIIGDAISGGTIRDVRINNTVGPNAHGVLLLNSTGNITLTDVDITSVDGNSFFVSGGDAAITHSGTILNDTGFAVIVQNNGGSVGMGLSDVTDNGGQGVGIFGSSGSTTLGNLTLNNVTGDALQIVNVLGGGVTLAQDVDINNPVGSGVSIRNLTGFVSSAGQTITINNRGDVGVDLETINRGTASFDVSFGDVTIAGTAATGSHGVDFQDSEGFVSFQSLSIADSNDTGVNIGGTLQNTGRFFVIGQTTISNATNSSIFLNSDASEVDFNGIGINNRGARGIEVLDHVGTARFAGLVTISNENQVLVPAIDVQGVTQSAIFGTVNATDTRGQSGVLVIDNPGDIAFTSLSVSSQGNTAVTMSRNAGLAVNGGVLDADTARALTMLDNPDFDVNFDEVNSTNSDYGIFIENLVDPYSPADPLLPRDTLDRSGDFAVRGTGSGALPGGTISGQAIAGAHFLNLDQVSLTAQEYTGNVIGIEADVINEVDIINTDVVDNTSFGFDGLDVFRLDILGSLFQANEGVNQIRYLANRTNVLDSNNDLVRAQYVVTLEDSTFTDATGAGAVVGGGDMIAIQTTGSVTSEGPELFLGVFNNGDPNVGGAPGFTSNRGFDDAIVGVTWRGDLGEPGVTGVLIDNNNFQMSTNAGQVGIRLTTTRPSTNRDTVVYTNNVLNDGGGGVDTGLLFDFAGAADVSITDNFGRDANGDFAVNGFQMEGANDLGDTAINLTFRVADNNVDVSRNAMVFNSSDGTGILFDAIAGPSDVTLNGNQIFMTDDLILPLERGIFFNRIVGSINLIGDVDNIINNSTLPFFINSGLTTGSIIVNGQTVP